MKEDMTPLEQQAAKFSYLFQEHKRTSESVDWDPIPMSEVSEMKSERNFAVDTTFPYKSHGPKHVTSDYFTNKTLSKARLNHLVNVLNLEKEVFDDQISCSSRDLTMILYATGEPAKNEFSHPPVNIVVIYSADKKATGKLTSYLNKHFS